MNYYGWYTGYTCSNCGAWVPSSQRYHACAPITTTGTMSHYYAWPTVDTEAIAKRIVELLKAEQTKQTQPVAEVTSRDVGAE